MVRFAIQILYYVLSDSVHERLVGLREALHLLHAKLKRESLVQILREDASSIRAGCGAVWDSIGDPEDDEMGDELTSVRSRSTAMRNLLDGNDRAPSHAPSKKPTRKGRSKLALANLEKNIGGGRTLSGSLASTVAAWIPVVFVGTHSTYSVVVPAGMKTLIPQYTMQGGQLVVDHYSMYTSSSSLSGWFPHAQSVVSLWTVPMFGGIFALSHSIDGIHGYLNNHCSLEAAVRTVSVGACAGLGMGLGYYSLVSLLGVASSPFVSLGLCSLWLIGCFVKRKPGEGFADLVIAGSANFGATIALVLTGGSSIVSLLAAIASSAIGGQVYSWGTQLWTKRLQAIMVQSACGVLQLEEDASPEEIRAAYRRLARVSHPDKSGDREAFELAHVARDILLLHSSEKSHQVKKQKSFFSALFEMASSIIPAQASPPRRLHITDEFLGSPD